MKDLPLIYDIAVDSAHVYAAVRREAREGDAALEAGRATAEATPVGPRGVDGECEGLLVGIRDEFDATGAVDLMRWIRDLG